MPASSRRARRWVVWGKVQGVWFRAFVEREARCLALTGRVRNLTDGTVEVLAHGTLEALEALGGRLRQGPPGARVEGLVAEDLAETQLWEEFRVER